MRHSSTTLEALALLCISLFGLSLLEYLLVSQAESESIEWIQHLSAWINQKPLLKKLQQLLFKLGYLIRTGALLSYAGLVYVAMQARIPASLTRERTSKSRFWFLLVLLVVFAAGFVMSPVFGTSLQLTFPLSLLGSIVLIPFIIQALQSLRNRPGYRAEGRRKPNADSLHIPTHHGYINIRNPYRGTLIMGSSGSGKSESIGNSLLSQFIQKGYCGVFYDFKFPTLAEVAHAALQQRKKPDQMPYFILNFQDLSRSHRCNPLSPENIPTPAHAEEYARTIVSNLDTSTIRHREFFSTSATAWLAALIWFYRTEYPQFSTLPHVINTVLYPDYAQVISMLETNPQSADMVRSIATAIQNKAEKQLAGVIASLQIMVSRINSAEIAWVLSGDDFDLALNNPANPKLLCVGSEPGLADTFSPVISLIITVALKRMNRQGQHKSFVLLDEAPTLYIPRFEVIPATARSNRIASVFMAQDFSQMQDMFGREKAAIITANLSNQFFGKVSTLSTAKTVSEMLGSQAQWQTHYSRGNSRDSKGRHNLSYNTSHSLQERVLVKPQEIMQLCAGEFVGRTVESKLPYFRDQVRLPKKQSSAAIGPFVSFDAVLEEMVQVNFERIRSEVQLVVDGYPNIYTGH